MRTHLDLFSGIGGFALACRWAGVETVGFAEIDNAPHNGLLGRVVNPSPQSGSLNPNWVEWLMGYPAGWTDLEA